MKFIDGKANVVDWTTNPNDKLNNMGAGKYGACCAEMDIWEVSVSDILKTVLVKRVLAHRKLHAAFFH